MSKPRSSKLPHDDGKPAASILIIEEQADIREFMSTALRLEGHQVEEAASGQRALEVLSYGRLDLVITDLSLSNVMAESYCRLPSGWHLGSRSW